MIGENTINTLPDETLYAFRDHGQLSDSLEADLDEAAAIMISAEEVDISMNQIAVQLVEEGIRKFVDPYTKLLDAIEKKREQLI